MNAYANIEWGAVRSISRLISRLENRDADAVKMVESLYPKCGNAHITGITGPPGAGKSCITAALIKEFREAGKRVGVLAVDPSSPFTGGAFLGDRARMEAFSNDDQVFIRSIASRGAEGGLARVVNDAVDVLDAAGTDIILIETAGVGQVETRIVDVAHTVVLVMVPGYGDMLQAMKAGILEIADIMAVNKSDIPGADKLANTLAALPQKQFGSVTIPCARVDRFNWPVPVLKTCALNQDGVADLALLIQWHYKHLDRGEGLLEKSKHRRKEQFLDILVQQIRSEFMSDVHGHRNFSHWIKKIETLDMSPYGAAAQVIDFYRNAKP